MLEIILEKLRENKMLVSFGVVGLLLGSVFLVFNQPNRVEQEPLVLSSSTKSDSSEGGQVLAGESATAEDQSKGIDRIVVDVKGEVKQAGLYELEVGSRVDDAIKAAGGVTDKADPKSINLAQKLEDEAIVYVASMEEGVSVIPESKATLSSDGTESSGKIDLNKATADDLQTIPGIGEKRAQDIIAYRESQGAFHSIDELKEISGIGDKTLEKLASYVRID